MRALFDVNALLALFDAQHVHYQRAHAWWHANMASGWASCPLTENGFVRISSQPGYPIGFTPASAAQGLATFASGTDHVFWPDDVSLLDSAAINPAAILGSGQIADIYLLALAVRHGGRLVTFDRSVSAAAILGAKPEHLVVP